jgi:hypothetical protein
MLNEEKTMKYLVIDLYTGNSTIHDNMDDRQLALPDYMKRVEGDRVVHLGEEVIVVEIND